MANYFRWMAINIFVPLTPFLIKTFIMIMGRQGVITSQHIAELPELVFFSIFLCIVNLNINYGGKKNIFETVLRAILWILIFLNCTILGMIYSKNVGGNMLAFTVYAAIFPVIIAPIYRFKYNREIEI